MKGVKNLTNGQFELDYDLQDQANEDFNFTRQVNYKSLDYLQKPNKNIPISYYIQNIRSGSFSQISETYMKQSSKQKSEEEHFTVDSFQTQMSILQIEFQNKLFKITTFFQGLYVGMALLYTITLNLSNQVAIELVRVEDQCMRIFCLLSTFGALYSTIISHKKYNIQKIRGTIAQVDRLYKSFILCFLELIFYFISYIIFNVSHRSALFYNIEGSYYTQLKSSTTAFTIITILGWLITNVNTYKYENKN